MSALPATTSRHDMNKLPVMNIGAVERDTGLGKDTLRVWERRYGFPQPTRDEHGERAYPAEQVDRLRVMKRLIDQGLRPGRLCAASEEEFAELSKACAAPPRDDSGQHAAVIGQTLALVKANDVAALRQLLNQAMMRLGLQRFVIDVVAPLNDAVGEAWMSGEFEVFEEHLYSEQIRSLLRQAIGNLPAAGGAPRILLTTPPDEQHVLGLLMVEALLALEGATCISLGTQTPLVDIEMAARAHQADIVAISISAAFPGRQVAALVSQLRQMLPAAIDLWVGGTGAQRATPETGIVLLPTLQAVLDALEAWRNEPAGTRHS
ncbi:MerR family transcriptional regulator [Candidatus Accumulibacter sp. ACC005]|uniref:MerR family transcriptional regulator n=1 Tax=Candidatus Accumulibacter sp. ACC005 TaxID=2823331 RepID=UPI0025BC43EE|nr:MerR family transcriptional regulator [Candidatus Accumulibacter sp. ACC005]